MSHWAQIDENNIVISVLVGDNNHDDEGYQWLVDNIGGRWIKTSINTYAGIHLQGKQPLRKNYAGIGYSYNEDIDAFVPPKPQDNPSFIINPETGLWKPPIDIPDTINQYIWDEKSISWILVRQPFPSWQLVNQKWTPPISYPNDNKSYTWNEETMSWVQIEPLLEQEGEPE
jgi:hypothetical protein